MKARIILFPPGFKGKMHDFVCPVAVPSISGHQSFDILIAVFHVSFGVFALFTQTTLCLVSIQPLMTSQFGNSVMRVWAYLKTLAVPLRYQNLMVISHNAAQYSALFECTDVLQCSTFLYLFETCHHPVTMTATGGEARLHC
jgi:hypothetical protein